MVGAAGVPEMAAQGAIAREKYRARELLNMFKDRKNHLYFESLCLLVQELENRTAKFQTSSPDMHVLLTLLNLQYKSIEKRVFDNTGKQLYCPVSQSRREI